MLKSITAELECDECGKPFSIDIDPASNVPDGWTPFEVVEDAVLGGGLACPSTSIQDGKHLCGICTQKRDAKPEAKS